MIVRIIGGRVGRKAARRTVLESLIDRQDHQLAGAAEAALHQDAGEIRLGAGIVALIIGEDFLDCGSELHREVLREVSGVVTPEARKGFIAHPRRAFQSALATQEACCQDAGVALLMRAIHWGKRMISMHAMTRRAFAAGFALVTIATSIAARADDAVLVFSGKVPGGEVTLTRDEIAKLPQRTLTEQPTSFPEPLAFEGPSLAEVLKLAGATGGDLTLSAADDYKIEITADEIKKYDPILAIEKGGVRMAPDD